MIISNELIKSYIEIINNHKSKVESIANMFASSSSEFKTLLQEYNDICKPDPNFINFNFERYLIFSEKVKDFSKYVLNLSTFNEIIGRLAETDLSNAYYKLIKHFIETLKSNDFDYCYENSLNYKAASDTVTKLNCILNSFNNNMTDFITNNQKNLEPIFLFYDLKEIKNNITLIGTNGSGKSRFSRQLLTFSDNPNFVVIAAQHFLGFELDGKVDLNAGGINLDGYQKSDKLSVSASDQFYQKEFGVLMNKLRSEHIRERYTKGVVSTIFNKVKELFHELIPAREIEYDFDTSKFYAVPPNGIKYDVNNMSDGEKSILFYILHIIFSDEHSFIIVDEPENHLHSDICTRLWDKLEEIRPDSIFIYLSHNIDFIASRKNSTIIWNKKFDYPQKWDFELLKDNELPKQLYLEILGTTPPVLLCEGCKNSKDIKVYEELFSDYKIRPCSSCNDVKEYVKTIKRLDVFKNKTVNGIIDLDTRNEKEVEHCVRDGVFVLNVVEIENLLFVPELLDKIFDKYSSDEQKNNFFDSFYSKASEELPRMVNRTLKDYFVKDVQSNDRDSFAEQVNTKYKAISFADQVSAKKTELENEFREIIETRNYDCALKKFDFKNQLYYIGESIIRDYLEKAVDILHSDKALADLIKAKYIRTNI